MIYFFQSLSLKVRFLALVLLLFPVLLFQWLLHSAPWALASLKARQGKGLPDALPWYDPEVLNGLLAAWDEAGRQLYLTVLWPTDLGLLLSYSALLAAAVLYLLKKVNPAAAWWYLLPLLPLAAGASDLLENLFVGAAVLLYPGWAALGWAAGICTAAKWSLLAATALVLVAGTAGRLLTGVWRRLL